jgi:predicted dithiol-disulfide oxidoreductase (DUF899 family)
MLAPLAREYRLPLSVARVSTAQSGTSSRPGSTPRSGDQPARSLEKTDPGPERQGLSAFYKDAYGAVFHTYSTYARGIDLLNGTYNCLDMAPKGRDEDSLEGGAQAWVRHHDRYED